MSYLARLKQIETEKTFADAPPPVLTKPTQAPFVSYGGSTQGHIENINGTESGGEIFTDSPVTVLTKPTEGAFVSYGSATQPPYEKNNNSRRWLFHFADRDDLQVTFLPAVNHAAALERYPDAVAAEPIPDPVQRTPTTAEANEITALIRAVFAEATDDDRNEALSVALADPGGALICYRTIAKDRGITVDVIH